MSIPDPSPGQEQQAAAPEGQTTDQPAAQQDATPAESSPATQGAEKPRSILDDVKAALKGAEAKAEKPAAVEDSPTPKDGSPKVDPKQPDAGVDEDEAEPDEKELSALHAKTQKRVRRLMRDRRALNDRVAALEPDATATQQMRDWAAAKGITKEDFNQVFSIMEAARTDPNKALQMLEPLRANLMKQAGHELPEDLAGEVDLGTIPEATAKELSILRAAAQRREEQDRLTAERTEREQAESDITTRGLNMAKAVQAAEAKLKRTDPDYERIQDFVKDRVESELMRKAPTSEKEAVEQFHAAVKAVKARAHGLLPPRKETTTFTGGHGSTNNRPVPDSALDAVKAALGR